MRQQLVPVLIVGVHGFLEYLLQGLIEPLHQAVRLGEIHRFVHAQMHSQEVCVCHKQHLAERGGGPLIVPSPLPPSPLPSRAAPPWCGCGLGAVRNSPSPGFVRRVRGRGSRHVSGRRPVVGR